VRAKPYFVKKVTSTTTDFSYEAKPQTRRAFDKDVTADVTDAMTYTVKTGGTATKLQRLGRPIAGKTGTSSYAKSIWFSGFVPQLAVSIGMYKPDAQGNPQTLTSSEDTNLTGGTVPADVFYDFMKVALQGMEVQDFPARAGVGDDKIPTPTTTFTPPPTTTFTPPPTTTQAPTTTTTTQAPPTTTQAPTTTQVPVPTRTGRPRPTTGTPTVTVPLGQRSSQGNTP
jgi:membrane peptidoglycan carboxypeptidase